MPIQLPESEYVQSFYGVDIVDYYVVEAQRLPVAIIGVVELTAETMAQWSSGRHGLSPESPTPGWYVILIALFTLVRGPFPSREALLAAVPWLLGDEGEDLQVIGPLTRAQAFDRCPGA